MSRQTGLVVLAALCAMALGAVAAPGAGAAINPYAAYTCVENAEGPFENAHCDKNAAGDGHHYKHVAIPAGETTQLTVEGIGNTKLKTKIGLATVTLEATGVECVGCHFKNVAGGTVEAAGGHLRYTGATISVASCKVVGSEVNTEALEVVVTSMEGEDSTGATYVSEVRPVTPGTVAVIHLENNGSSCALGTSITVTGHATGKATGSTAKFATGAEELLVGTQKAELTGELTLKGGLTPTVENPNPVHNPIGLTTNTVYTAYTCVEDPEGPFENAHCDKKAASDGHHYKHVAIPAGETTQLTVEGIGANTKFKTKIGLVTVTFEATGVECVGCHFKNVAGGTVETSGGHLRYTGVTISVASCKVVGEEINTEPLEVVVTSMEGEDSTGATYVSEVRPVTPGTVLFFHLENNGATCALGTSITVTGHATGKRTGSTTKFATGAEELLVGTQKVELISELTVKGGLTPTPENPNPVHYPIGLTTGA